MFHLVEYRVEKSVYDKLSKVGSLGTTYSEVIDSALDAYLKQAVAENKDVRLSIGKVN